MCGIAGIWHFAGSTVSDDVARTAADMASHLAHRGPDASGVFVDENACLAFGHRRLSIVDLSPAGAQPMTSQSGRYVICYNGEVYNAADIRADLEQRGVRFRGHSDTEVLLEACAVLGLDAAIERSIGMFAFAVFDRERQELHLVRDRLGIKPLYYAFSAGRLVFSSELTALFAVPGFSPEIDRNSLATFLHRACVPAPLTIYEGVCKLEAGRILSVDAGGKVRKRAYWTLANVVKEATTTPVDVEEGPAIDSLEELLGDAVERRMVADVPVGAFLSGGIDSSTIVALMQRRGSRPARTFTIGFGERDYDEAAYAREIARHLGTDHTELLVTADEARATIPDLATIYDEPFADSSQIPTLLVSRLARGAVTVALSGDGGDEVFAGYTRHVHAATRARLAMPAVRPLARFAGQLMDAVPARRWDGLVRRAPFAGLRRAGETAQKIASVIGTSEAEYYAATSGVWPDPGLLLPGAEWTSPYSSDILDGLPVGAAERIQYLDTVGYLADDILTKVDRASMAVSLEARVPMLDHRVVAFAWSLPTRFRIAGGKGKYLLRRLLARHVPEHLFERPKMGFGVPIDDWLRGPLREWAGDLLASASEPRGGYFAAAPIERAWADHLSGRRNRHHELWAILMFESWRNARMGLGRGHEGRLHQQVEM